MGKLTVGQSLHPIIVCAVVFSKLAAPLRFSPSLTKSYPTGRLVRELFRRISSVSPVRPEKSPD